MGLARTAWLALALAGCLALAASSPRSRAAGNAEVDHEHDHVFYGEREHAVRKLTICIVVANYPWKFGAYQTQAYIMSQVREGWAGWWDGPMHFDLPPPPPRPHESPPAGGVPPQPTLTTHH